MEPELTASATSSWQHEFESPPWRRFESTLMATSRAIRRLYDLYLREFNINLSEAVLLSYVDQIGPINQTQAARTIGLSRASGGLIIDALTARGLVERERDPTDRRAWLLSTTDQGHEITARVADLDKRLREQMRGGLSRADRLHVAVVLQAIRENIAAAEEQYAAHSAELKLPRVDGLIS